MAENSRFLDTEFGRMVEEFHWSANKQDECVDDKGVVLTSYRDFSVDGNTYVVALTERSPEFEAYARLMDLLVFSKGSQHPPGRFSPVPARGFEILQFKMVLCGDSLAAVRELSAVYRDRVNFLGYRIRLKYALGRDRRTATCNSMSRVPIIPTQETMQGKFVGRDVEQRLIKLHLPTTIDTVLVISAVVQGDVAKALNYIRRP